MDKKHLSSIALRTLLFLKDNKIKSPGDLENIVGNETKLDGGVLKVERGDAELTRDAMSIRYCEKDSTPFKITFNRMLDYATIGIVGPDSMKRHLKHYDAVETMPKEFTMTLRLPYYDMNPLKDELQRLKSYK